MNKKLLLTAVLVSLTGIAHADGFMDTAKGYASKAGGYVAKPFTYSGGKIADAGKWVNGTWVGQHSTQYAVDGLSSLNSGASNVRSSKYVQKPVQGIKSVYGKAVNKYTVGATAALAVAGGAYYVYQNGMDQAQAKVRNTASNVKKKIAANKRKSAILAASGAAAAAVLWYLFKDTDFVQKSAEKIAGAAVATKDAVVEKAVAVKDTVVEAVTSEESAAPAASAAKKGGKKVVNKAAKRAIKKVAEEAAPVVASELG